MMRASFAATGLVARALRPAVARSLVSRAAVAASARPAAALALARPAVPAAAPSTRLMSSQTFPGSVPYLAHLCDGPDKTKFEATKEQLMEYFRTMYTIRRMEISADNEYKARAIRGFCHLYDGQEAVAMGLQAGLTAEDSITTAYRCHGLALVRGDTVERIMAEMFGFVQGSSGGKGGSMHLYNSKANYWGGSGIVGAQVPVGAGVGFAAKYKAKGAFPVPASVVMYGDGAANQGQIWEAANMCALWKLPVIFMCENNNYGMGTSTNRHSCNQEYYKQGGVAIPGIQIDGMDVLAVRDGVKWARDFVGGGNGPLFVEMKTYRYHGHSMSDPGITYRSRDEVSGVRQSRDCIENVKQRLLDTEWATKEELKAVEKEVRAEVAAATKAAKAGNPPPASDLYTHVYVEGVPEYVRGNEYATSIGAK